MPETHLPPAPAPGPVTASEAAEAEDREPIDLDLHEPLSPGHVRASFVAGGPPIALALAGMLLGQPLALALALAWLLGMLATGPIAWYLPITRAGRAAHVGLRTAHADALRLLHEVRTDQIDPEEALEAMCSSLAWARRRAAARAPELAQEDFDDAWQANFDAAFSNDDRRADLSYFRGILEAQQALYLEAERAGEWDEGGFSARLMEAVRSLGNDPTYIRVKESLDRETELAERLRRDLGPDSGVQQEHGPSDPSPDEAPPELPPGARETDPTHVPSRGPDHDPGAHPVSPGR